MTGRSKALASWTCQPFSGAVSTTLEHLPTRFLTKWYPWLAARKSSAPNYLASAIIDSCPRGTGNATLKIPHAGFAHDGLARLFGVSPTVSKVSASSHRTAEVAAPICAVLGLAVLVALASLIRKYWRRMGTGNKVVFHEKGASDIPEEAAVQTG